MIGRRLAILACGLALIALVALGGCGGSDDSGAPDQPTAQAGQQPGAQQSPPGRTATKHRGGSDGKQQDQGAQPDASGERGWQPNGGAGHRFRGGNGDWRKAIQKMRSHGDSRFTAIRKRTRKVLKMWRKSYKTPAGRARMRAFMQRNRANSKRGGDSDDDPRGNFAKHWRQRAKQVKKRIESGRPAAGCDQNYVGACLDPKAPDYDCNGKGNGPYFTGKVKVVGKDRFGLDPDGDGIGCD